MGCAFEDPTLFSASVRENVSYGSADAGDAAIAAALAAAQADFVYDLPWGLDTRIGEQGMALSGGQRQRVALARAILARPEILILDDPLSALDVHTEAKVTEALRQVLTDSTALVVAHRPSTVMLADRVAMLADGVIVAQGTHRELLDTEPRYRDLMSPAALGARRPRRRHRRRTAPRPTAPRTDGTRTGRHRDRRHRDGRHRGARADRGTEMSQATEPAWRGIAAEEAEEIPPSLATFLRLRSRRLLADMLRPHRRASLVILHPDRDRERRRAGRPVAGRRRRWTKCPSSTKTHDAVPLTLVVIGFGVAVVVQALTTRAYISAIGRMGGKVVLELRRRLFGHFQALPVAFHERYTTGKVISRQVSDIDAISDLFEEGLDSLVSAIFSLLLVGTGMLLLDWPLALVVMAGFIPLIWLTAWFRRRVRPGLPPDQGDDRPGHRAVRGDVRRYHGGAGVPPGGAESGALHRPQRRLRGRASLRSQRLIAVYFPGVTLVGNLAMAAMLLYGGLRVIDGDMQVGVLVTFLLYLQRFFDPLQDLSQFYSTFQSAAAAMEKISGVLDEDPAVAEPDAPVSLPDPADAARAGRAVRFEAVRFGYRDKAGAARPGPGLSRPARRWPSSARPARARPPSRGCWPVSTIRGRAGSCWTAWTSDRCPSRTCAARSS